MHCGLKGLTFNELWADVGRLDWHLMSCGLTRLLLSTHQAHHLSSLTSSINNMEKAHAKVMHICTQNLKYILLEKQRTIFLPASSIY